MKEMIAVKLKTYIIGFILLHLLMECVCYVVHSCPISEEKWTEASRLNCQKNDEYHCVRDALKTKLIVVCTTNIHIVGKVCAEYNIYGKVLQRSGNANCSSCPDVYNSNDIWKYPECFSLKTDTNQTTEWPVMNYTKAEMAPLQQNESTQTTSAGTFLHIETTTDATQVTDIQKRPTDTPGIKFPTVFFARGLHLAVGLFSIILPTVVIAIKLGENRYKNIGREKFEMEIINGDILPMNYETPASGLQPTSLVFQDVA